MRKVMDHVADEASAKLEITVTDEPGAGGASHSYLIEGPNSYPLGHVKFQNGPIKENGINGVTQEVLLAIVIDRLRSFQAGEFACRENAAALANCEQALMWLFDRRRRGVEGTNQQ